MITKQGLKKEILNSFSASRPRKILFDHLPKCGGTSLKTYLEEHYPRRKIFTIDHYPKNKTLSLDDKNPVASIKKY